MAWRCHCRRALEAWPLCARAALDKSVTVGAAGRSGVWVDPLSSPVLSVGVLTPRGACLHFGGSHVEAVVSALYQYRRARGDLDVPGGRCTHDRPHAVRAVAHLRRLGHILL